LTLLPAARFPHHGGIDWWSDSKLDSGVDGLGLNDSHRARWLREVDRFKRADKLLIVDLGCWLDPEIGPFIELGNSLPSYAVALAILLGGTSDSGFT